MRVPIGQLIDILESELTEERCDALAKATAVLVAAKGGVMGKIASSFVYTGLDLATPELLFKALRNIFPDGHEVDVEGDDEQ